MSHWLQLSHSFVMGTGVSI